VFRETKSITVSSSNELLSNNNHDPNDDQQDQAVAASWSDDEFEAPALPLINCTSNSNTYCIGASAAAGELGASAATVATKDDDNVDWHEPSAKKTNMNVSQLLKDTSVQAVYSLNTPACRKKPRCVLCTRPLHSSDTDLCERCQSSSS
jgi:hypothetical protein